MTVVVEFLRDFGLITGEVLATDGQLEPAHSRFTGCAYACQGCQEFTLDAGQRQERCHQLPSGAKRLELLCPFPEGVDKVRQATAKKGTPTEPQVALLEVEYGPPKPGSAQAQKQVATLLGLPKDAGPP